MNLDEKVVIVTGAGTGIGRELARKLLDAGCRVVLAGRRIEKLRETVAQHPGADRAAVISIDVARRADLTRLLATCTERFGQLDILVNNAAVGYGGAISDVRPEEVEYMMKVDLIAPIWLTQLAIPLLAQRPEAMIVNVSSLAGLVAIPNQSFYSAAKHGVHGFSHALRREFLGTPIRVLTVYPGGVESELMSDVVRAKMKEEQFGMFDMMKAAVAADIIVDGMRRDRAKIFVTKAIERNLVRLNHVAPAIVDRRMKSMRTKIRAIVCAATETVRARALLPSDDV